MAVFTGDIYRVYNQATNEWDYHLFATKADVVITEGTGLNFLSNNELNFLQGIMGGGSGGGTLNKIRLGVTDAHTIDTSDSQPLKLGNDVIIGGSLTVQGTTTTINTQDIAVVDKDIILAKNNTTPAAASGGGIKIKVGTDAYRTFTWELGVGEGNNGAWVSDAGIGVGPGFAYYIGTTKVLNGDTLGSTVTKSSLTKLGLSAAGFVLSDVNGNLTVKSALTASDIPDITSQKITAITGYSEAATYSQLTTTDSLNTALGKLQKGLNVVRSAVTKKTAPTASDYNRKELIEGLIWFDDGSTVVEPNVGLYTLRLRVLGAYGTGYQITNDIIGWRDNFYTNFAGNFNYPVALFSANFGFLQITFTGYQDRNDVWHNDFLLHAYDFAGNTLSITTVIPNAVVSTNIITAGELIGIRIQGEANDFTVNLPNQDLVIPGGRLIYLNNVFLCPGIYIDSTLGA